MWTYQQATGFLIAPNGARLVPAGYAGWGVGKNNPSLQSLEFVGPIPQGVYEAGEPEDSIRLGKFAIPLVPRAENEMYGRSGFFMHGDSLDNPGNASDGCIVQSYEHRVMFWDSTDHVLQVVSGILT
jgi:hypothetical protein